MRVRFVRYGGEIRVRFVGGELAGPGDTPRGLSSRKRSRSAAASAARGGACQGAARRGRASQEVLCETAAVVYEVSRCIYNLFLIN